MNDVLSQEALYSELAADPDLGELVDMFVSEIPLRVESLLQCMESQDWTQLARLAHQLKGASGSYGFHQMTPFAQRLEQFVKEQRREDEIRASVDELIRICGKLRAGVSN